MNKTSVPKRLRKRRGRGLGKQGLAHIRPAAAITIFLTSRRATQARHEGKPAAVCCERLFCMQAKHKGKPRCKFSMLSRSCSTVSRSVAFSIYTYRESIRKTLSTNRDKTNTLNGFGLLDGIATPEQ